MSRELDRMLRRVRSRSLPESVLDGALEREIGRLIDEPEAQGNRVATAEPALDRFFHDLDAATWEAHRRHAEGRFVEALAALHRADAVLAVLRRLEHASAERAEVERERRRLVAALGLAPFLGLPTLRIVDRLLARSGALIPAGEPQKALVMVRLARRLLARLALMEPAREGDLERRLERLSRQIEAGPASARLDRVRDLAHEGYGRLAARLADELEVELDGWRTANRLPGSGDRWRRSVIRDLADTEGMADALARRLATAAGET